MPRTDDISANLPFGVTALIGGKLKSAERQHAV